jgi:fucose permease
MSKRQPVLTLPIMIGLGLLILAAYMDNSRGPLLPHIAHSMGFDYAGSSLFLVVGHVAACFATAALMPSLNRFNERTVTWLCCGIGLITCASSILVTDYSGLLVFAGALGICNAILGTMSNIVVMAHSDAHRIGRNLGMLHIMYGVGSMLGTVITGQVLAQGWDWSFSLLTLVPVYLCLAWRTRFLSDSAAMPGQERRQPVTMEAAHWLIVALFAFYVAGEVLTSMWMTAYLVETDGMDIGRASMYTTLFFVMMAASRCLVIFDRIHRWSAPLLGGCIAAGAVCSILGLLGWRYCLPLVGLIGPFFPLLLARVSKFYPQRHRTITIYVVIAMQVALATLHFAIGQFSMSIPIRLSYWLAPSCLGATLVLYFCHLKLTMAKDKQVNILIAD